MTTLEKANKILEYVLAMNPEPRVAPGLPRAEIREKLRGADIDESDDLVEIYAWHNGVSYLNAFLSYLDLEFAIETYKGLRSHKLEIPEFRWKEGLFPVLWTNGDIYHCVDLETGATYDIDIEGDGFLKTADHFHHYLNALICAFDENRVTFDPLGGALSIDENNWSNLEKRFEIQTDYELFYGI